MQIFVYEELTATGHGADPRSPDHGMYCEGKAMAAAITADFILAGHRITSSLSDADAAIMIAPETDGLLDRQLDRCEYFPRLKSLNCAHHATVTCANKLKLSEKWARNGIRTPMTLPASEWPADRFPAVAKPIAGCGSTGIQMARSADEIHACRRKNTILQDYVPGRAASVAFLCNGNVQLPLAPTFQHLSDDGAFTYQGGELPIPPDLAARAITIATAAISKIRGLNGYVGVDLVLGNATDGSEDYAIEINPRLTTSYIGLRALAGFNIAQSIIEMCMGTAITIEPIWHSGHVRFRSDGAVSKTTGGQSAR
jgi:tyramine---L-glutamate ligase